VTEADPRDLTRDARADAPPPGPPARSGPGRKAAWCALIAAVALAADVATKAWATARLSGGRDVTAGPLLRFQLVVNHGASLGLAAGAEPLLAVVAVAGVLLFSVWAVRAASAGQRLGAALAAAGAAGNLVDRLARAPGVLHGGVVDWIHLSFYGPTFNLADLWLRAGVLIAVIGWLGHRRSTPQPRAGTAGPPLAD
jgi:signal peptidase II